MELGGYRLDRRLASTATLETFAATTTADGVEQRVVLERPVDDAKVLAVFKEDANVALRLIHPKIVQTLELVSTGETHYVTREHVEGVDVLGLLRELARESRSVQPSVAVWIVHEVLDALSYAYSVEDRGEPVVHGRITMTSVHLSLAGDVKLGGFGAPRPIDLYKPNAHPDLTHTAPEHVNGQPIDAYSDVFVAGVLLAELLTGRRLFLAGHELDVFVMVRDVHLERFDARASGLDAALVDIAKTAMRKRPAERYESAAVFRDALAAWLVEKGAGNPREELGALVADVRAARERNGDEHVPDVDVRYHRAATIPPFAGAAAGVATPRTRTPPQGIVVKGVVTIPERGTGQIHKPALVVPAAPAKPVHAAAVPVLAAAASVEQHQVVEVAASARAMTTAPGPQLGTVMGEPAFVPVDEIAAMRAAHSVIVDVEREADESGTFAERSPIGVLFKLMVSRGIGLFVIARGATRTTLHFRDGQPQSVWSNDPAGLLGPYLVSKSVINDGHLKTALARITERGGKLSDTLLELGYINPVGALRHLKGHVASRIADICTWTDGRFGWFRGTQVEREAYPLEGDSFAMLGEGALALDDETLNAWVAKFGRMRPNVGRDNRVSPTRFSLSGLTELYDGIDGETTIDAMLARQADPLERARLTRMLYLLVTCELVR